LPAVRSFETGWFASQGRFMVYFPQEASLVRHFSSSLDFQLNHGIEGCIHCDRPDWIIVSAIYASCNWVYCRNEVCQFVISGTPDRSSFRLVQLYYVLLCVPISNDYLKPVLLVLQIVSCLLISSQVINNNICFAPRLMRPTMHEAHHHILW
jgi:hypothetical protein